MVEKYIISILYNIDECCRPGVESMTKRRLVVFESVEDIGAVHFSIYSAGGPAIWNDDDNDNATVVAGTIFTSVRVRWQCVTRRTCARACV